MMMTSAAVPLLLRLRSIPMRIRPRRCFIAGALNKKNLSSSSSSSSSESRKKLSKLTDNPKSWEGCSLLSVQQITSSGLGLLFEVSQQMRLLVADKGGGDDRLKHKVIGTVFLEPSTRTTASFQAAIQRLGGSYVDYHTTFAGQEEEEESLEDTIRCLESYCDVTILRHPISGSLQKALQVATKPIISGGDGSHEHPTQALLDVYTIYSELNLWQPNMPRDDLTVVFAGDLKNGRTVHSLAALLAETTSDSNGGNIWNSLTLRYCSPPGYEIPKALQNYINTTSQQRGVSVVQQESYQNLTEACQGANVLYVTHTPDAAVGEQQQQQVNTDLLRQAPSDMVILHPLPRSHKEIDFLVDNDPRAAYFRQVQNGMLVRMALLSLIFGKAQ